MQTQVQSYSVDHPPCLLPLPQSGADLETFLSSRGLEGVSIVYRGDVPILELQTKQSSARLSPWHGANLLSFISDGFEQIWHNPETVGPVEAGTPAGIVRGGDPLCGPYIGRLPDRISSPLHGELRRWPWTLVDASNSDGLIQVKLQLALPGYEPWGAPFLAQYSVTLGTDSIATRLGFTHLGKEPRIVNLISHRYLNLTNDTMAELTGLENLAYLDMMAGGERCEGAEASPLDFSENVTIERRYPTIRPGEMIVLTELEYGRCFSFMPDSDTPSSIIWRPNQGKKATLPDVPSGSQILCVEFGNIQDALLEPGATRTIGYSMHVRRDVIRSRQVFKDVSLPPSK